jgi:hypothetical protein
MSIKRKMPLWLSLGSTLAVMAILALVKHGTNVNDRQIASVAQVDKVAELMSGFKSSKIPRFIHTNKVNAPIKVSVATKVDFIEDYSQPFEVIGTIQSRKNIDSMRIRWQLPEGFEMVSGSFEETVYGINANEPKEVVVSLRKLDHAIEGNILMEAYIAQNGHKAGGVGVLQSKYLKEAHREDLMQKAHFQFLKQEKKEKRIFR